MKTAQDLVTEAKSQIQEISLDQAETALKTTDYVIDVRENAEFQAGHIPKAIHISRGMLEFKLSNTPQFAPRDIEIVLYCKSSGRAALAALTLKAMGYTNVKSIAGGFDAWVASGRSVIEPKVS